MIQKQTTLLTTDKSGLNLIKTFHLYSGFHRHWSAIGFFVKGSARFAVNKKFKNMNIFRKIKKVRKGLKVKVIITRQSYLMFRFDSSSLYVKDNTCLALKKKNLTTFKIYFWSNFYKF